MAPLRMPPRQQCTIIFFSLPSQIFSAALTTLLILGPKKSSPIFTATSRLCFLYAVPIIARSSLLKIGKLNAPGICACSNSAAVRTSSSGRFSFCSNTSFMLIWVAANYYLFFCVSSFTTFITSGLSYPFCKR